jgi:hypothetical protein
MRIVRELAVKLAVRCGDALLAGVAIERVDRNYFRRLHELADEAEAQALLAASGSAEAVAAIEDCIDGLSRLTVELEKEIAQAAGDEPDARVASARASKLRAISSERARCPSESSPCASSRMSCAARRFSSGVRAARLARASSAALRCRLDNATSERLRTRCNRVITATETRATIAA